MYNATCIVAMQVQFISALVLLAVLLFQLCTGVYDKVRSNFSSSLEALQVVLEQQFPLPLP